MRASLDTNVIIHLYRANMQRMLFEIFKDGVFIYEQIRNIELEHHGKIQGIERCAEVREGASVEVLFAITKFAYLSGFVGASFSIFRHKNGVIYFSTLPLLFFTRKKSHCSIDNYVSILQQPHPATGHPCFFSRNCKAAIRL